MAAFTPPKVGGWAYGEILTSAQMNHLNADIPFALNGRDGGDYAPSGDLNVQSPAGKVVVVNGVTFASTADGGSLACGGIVGSGSFATTGSINGRRVMIDVTGGSGAAAGTHLFSYLYNHIVVRGGVSFGCIWQIQANPPTGDSGNKWVMRFVNFDSTVITVRNPSASTLATLVATTGNQFAATVAWDGSSWVRVDASFWP